jgi:glyoxylate/hydroxypyruvate reductase A
MHALMHIREQRRLDAAQAAGKWEPFAAFAAKDFTVGIMGLGVLGQDAARKLGMLGFKLAGWSRTRRQIEGVACFAGAAQLGDFLAQTDILLCILPATPETEGLLNRSLFQKLSRKGPFKAPILINVGRGKLQNEADIAACLQDGTLRAATLDVFREEPLPPHSPLWKQPGLTITPHAAADSEPSAICAYVAAQIGRHMKGEELPNQVDRARGY